MAGLFSTRFVLNFCLPTNTVNTSSKKAIHGISFTVQISSHRRTTVSCTKWVWICSTNLDLLILGAAGCFFLETNVTLRWARNCGLKTSKAVVQGYISSQLQQSFIRKNKPFPSCFVPLFQSESWCIAFHMKMSFHSNADKTHFHKKGFARGFALKKRHKTIRKWPILTMTIK